MTTEPEPSQSGNIEPIFRPSDSSPVSDELQKLTGMIAPLCPRDTVIKFEFDGKLHLHIDVRQFEAMTTLEAMLPTICGGIFHDVQRGVAEKHSFFHRLTAIVQR